MTAYNRFLPDWTSAPGETIDDILQERNLSRADFADRLGLADQETDDLLQGRAAITITIARRLNRVLGASVGFWMLRDMQYRQDVRRLWASGEKWLQEIPVGDMIRFGWITPTPHPSEELAACLNFFNVSSVLEWRDKYASLHEMATFRTSPSFDSRPASVAAWLRQGEIEANTIECKPWRPELFREALQSIRSLTRRKDPNRFVPELRRACAETGVALVIVRAPSGCRASGATRIVSPCKAILQLSFRYLTDDHFWFTFFHEAGHLILHAERDIRSSHLRDEGLWIIEGLEGSGTTEEEEANQFAAYTLVPEELQNKLDDIPLSKREVIKFARLLGLSPGIVVGQLQHRGRLDFSEMNRLKRRFEWSN